MQRVVIRRAPLSAERRFYVGFIATILFALLLGFARTFFLRPWFPEWAAAHSGTEPFLYFHGVLFVGWFVLLLAQESLVVARRVDVHRRLGMFGAGLAFLMVIVGTIATITAARRSTGFFDVPVPPLQFMAIPLADVVMFAIFVTLAIVKRRDVQSHKHYIILASIMLLDAAVARWPFAIMLAPSPVPAFTMPDLMLNLFLIPLIVWDLFSRGRLHPVTLWGGLALIACQPLRFLISQTHAWLVIAQWLVSL